MLFMAFGDCHGVRNYVYSDLNVLRNTVNVYSEKIQNAMYFFIKQNIFF